MRTRLILSALVVTLRAVLLVSGAVAAVEIEPPDNRIFAADAGFECVYSRTAKLASGLTEGPAVAPDGSIYFTDVPFGPQHDTIINRFDPATKMLSVFTASAGKANGLAFDAEGRLLAADGADGGGRCIRRYDLQTGQSTIVADRFDGRRLNAPDDLCVDRQGRIYFTDPFCAGDETRELAARAIYSVERDGRVVEITRDVEMPNGIVLSPDGTTLYVGDHNNGGTTNGSKRTSPGDPARGRGAMRAVAFPLDAEWRVAGPQKTLVEFGTGDDAHSLYVSIDKKLCRIRTKTTEARPVWAREP